MCLAAVEKLLGCTKAHRGHFEDLLWNFHSELGGKGMKV